VPVVASGMGAPCSNFFRGATSNPLESSEYSPINVRFALWVAHVWWMTYMTTRQKERTIGGRFALLFLTSGMLLLTGYVTSAQQIDPVRRHVEGELLVKFRGGTKGAEARAARARLGHKVKRDFDLIGWQHMQLPRAMSVGQALQHYRALPEVLAVEPNGFLKFSGSTMPNDPMFSQQWALRNINASNAWAVTAGSSNVVVAVIDTGVNYNHEDLAANMWRNPGEIPGNGIDDDGNGLVDDLHGIDTRGGSNPWDFGFTENGMRFYHGTSCAGILGAVGGNGLGGAGANWRLQVMAIRLIGTNNFLEMADAIAAFEYVTLMKRRGINIRVTSNSWGTDPIGLFSQAMNDAVAAAGSEGILNVFASGNDSTNMDAAPFYPAAYRSPSILSVAASDQSDNLASFSNYGRTNVDLAAPGVSIVTPAGGSNNAAYSTTFNGTSAACPYVAGAAALLSPPIPPLGRLR
jgi:hypothetical protein